MPNRILKETICTSDDINALTHFEEVVFYRLIVTVDDYGRFDARLPILKARLFPLKPDVTLKNIETAISKLVSVGLVSLYTVEGDPFLRLPAWSKHQRLRKTKAKFPAPEEADGNMGSAADCGDLPQPAATCGNLRQPAASGGSRTRPRAHTESESESESEVESESESIERDMLASFKMFVRAYPKKVKEKEAWREFQKLNPSSSQLATILQAIETQKKSIQWNDQGGKFIPDPHNWLAREGWKDELPLVLEGDALLKHYKKLIQETEHESEDTEN